MLDWGDIYCLNIKEVDEHHKVFFDIVEEAEALLGRLNVDGINNIYRLIERIQDFARDHFVLEEEFMESIDYPHRLEHKMEHAIFSAQITHIDLSVVEADAKEYLLRTLDFMIEWIILHIANADTNMAKYYHETYNK